MKKRNVNPKILKLIERYLRYIKQRGYTAETLRAYSYELPYIFSLIEEKVLEEADKNYSIGDLKIIHIDDLLYCLREEKKNSDTSIARKLSCLSSFYSYLEKRDLLKDKLGKEVSNILKKIDPPTQEKRIPKVPSYSAFKKFKKALENRRYRNEFEEISYKLFFYLKFCAMARTVEMTRIRVEDLDFDKRTLLIKGKGKKERIVPVTKHSLMLAWRFIQIAELQNGDLLIRSKDNRPITKRALELREETVRREAGLPDWMTLHKLFRKTPATLLKARRKDIGLSELQDLLGHEDPETTRIYVESQSEKVIEDLHSNHPFDEM
jgi:site-specific recombinase XerD